MKLEGKTALITGGTAGIGLEAARLLLRDGAAVIVTGRDANRGKMAIAELGADAAVRFVQADLSSLESIDGLVSEAGELDVLVNNAGAFPVAPTVEQDVASFQKIVDTNITGTFFLTARLVPAMLAKGAGSIINVTSLAAHVGVPGAAAYSASKAAMASFTRSWTAEFSPHGVRVNSVAPGPTITDGVLVEWGDGVKELGTTLPLGRTATPQEIAQAILFLASDRSSFVTGSTLHVDGGGSPS